MLLPAILYTFKGKLLLGFWVVFTTFAVTEAFLGQLLIAVVVALIGATPPTAAIIVMARKQSAERKAANEVVLKAVDGQTTKLVEATKQFSHLAGKEEERIEERGRQGEAAKALQADVPTPVEIVGVTPETPLDVKQHK